LERGVRHDRDRLSGVQMSEFWTLIEQARADASEDNDAWPSSSAIGAALVDRLVQLPPERIVEFDHCYSQAASRAHQWRVCASAFLIWNYVSDDSFSDFKAGLVGLGQDAFEHAVADPDVLADHPMVRAIAAGHIDRFALVGEAIQFAASQAYERCTDDADGFWEALEGQPAEATGRQDTSGEPWSGRFGGPDDATQIPLRLPRLHALFASSEADSR
jgi:hypothetical protein